MDNREKRAKRNYERWTDESKAFVRANYRKLTLAEIGRQTNRTPGEVAALVRRLKINQEDYGDNSTAEFVIVARDAMGCEFVAGAASSDRAARKGLRARNAWELEAKTGRTAAAYRLVNFEEDDMAKTKTKTTKGGTEG